MALSYLPVFLFISLLLYLALGNKQTVWITKGKFFFPLYSLVFYIMLLISTVWCLKLNRSMNLYSLLSSGVDKKFAADVLVNLNVSKIMCAASCSRRLDCVSYNYHGSTHCTFMLRIRKRDCGDGRQSYIMRVSCILVSTRQK